MKTEMNHAEQQAVAQLESIKEMVAAFNCDYDRLEALHDERDSFEPNQEIGPWPEKWELAFPDDAEELAALEAEAGECEGQDSARQRIDEDPLSVQVRGGWHDAGAEDDGAEEYLILLCTGGPACRIIGDLNAGEPTSARLQYQDWGTPWTEHIVTGEDHDALMSYVRNFYFGE